MCPDTGVEGKSQLLLSGIYHPEHQKNNIENQVTGKMKKVNRNSNPCPENINIIIFAVSFFNLRWNLNYPDSLGLQ